MLGKYYFKVFFLKHGQSNATLETQLKNFGAW